MSWGLEKERRTFWRITTAEGDSMAFDTKEKAVERLKNELNTARVKVALAQQEVHNAHRSCSLAMEKYKDFLVHRSDMELDLRVVSSSHVQVAWITGVYLRESKYCTTVQQDIELLLAMPKAVLQEYVRYHLLYELKKRIKALRSAKSRYYETVKFSKMARDFRFDEED